MFTHGMNVDEACSSSFNDMNETYIINGVMNNSVVHCLLRYKNESNFSKWWDQRFNSLINMEIVSTIIHRHLIAHAFTGIKPETTGIPMNFTASVFCEA